MFLIGIMDTEKMRQENEKERKKRNWKERRKRSKGYCEIWYKWERGGEENT